MPDNEALGWVSPDAQTGYPSTRPSGDPWGLLPYLHQKELDKQNTIAGDSGNDAIEKLANELNIKLDDTTKDYLMQYYLSEKSNNNAWSRQMDASNTQYQRAVVDLQKAGLNPFLALQSLNGSSPSSSGQSVQGGLYTSKKNALLSAKATYEQRKLAVLGIIAAAIIAAL